MSAVATHESSEWNEQEVFSRTYLRKPHSDGRVGAALLSLSVYEVGQWVCVAVVTTAPALLDLASRGNLGRDISKAERAELRSRVADLTEEVFDSHGHDVIGQFATSTEAMDAGDVWATRWLAGEFETASCACEPVEK